MSLNMQARAGTPAPAHLEPDHDHDLDLAVAVPSTPASFLGRHHATLGSASRPLAALRVLAFLGVGVLAGAAVPDAGWPWRVVLAWVALLAGLGALFSGADLLSRSRLHVHDHALVRVHDDGQTLVHLI